MKKLLLFFCALVISTSVVAESFPKYITLNTVGNPPLNTRDHTGFMDQVAMEAFSRLGIKLRMVKLPAERGLRNANLGIEDGEMSRVEGLDKNYKNLIRVPEKIMNWNFVAFSKHSIQLNNGWNDLKPFNIAFINGWKILEKNTKGFHLIKVKTASQLFTMLRKNRTEVILYEEWAGLFMRKKFHASEIELLAPPLSSNPMFIYLHKKHKDLVEPLAKALQEMKSDGSYQRYVTDILDPLRSSLK